MFGKCKGIPFQREGLHSVDSLSPVVRADLVISASPPLTKEIRSGLAQPTGVMDGKLLHR